MSNLSKKEILELYKKVIKESYVSHSYTWYEADFKSIYELYNYLKSEPENNTKIFLSLASQTPSKVRERFYEEEYEVALENLIGKYSKNVEQLLDLKRNLNKTIYFPSTRRNVTKSFTGSRICPNSFIANDPKRYYKLERVQERKFIRIYVNLAYSSETNINAILNRGALIYNLVNMLEENNYGVELNTFFLLKEANELIYIKVRLKNINQKFSVHSSAYPFLSRDFQRRIIFKVIETLHVENSNWRVTYGVPVTDFEAKKLLSLKSSDIYIGLPNEMNIIGEDLKEDVDSFLNYLDIKKYVKVKIK